MRVARVPFLILAFIILMPGMAWAVARYVDNTLAATCSGSTYSIASRACTGTDGPGYKTLQEACNVVNPGDVVHVRAGTFNFTYQTNACTLTRSGAAGNPITIQNYGTELAYLKGPYDVDADADGVRDMDEEGYISPDGGDRAKAFELVGANYVTIKGFKIGWFYRGMELRGNFITVTENLISDTGVEGMLTRGDNFTISYNHITRVRHNTGIHMHFYTIGGMPAGRSDNSVLYRNLIFGNGRHCTNADCTTDEQVLPIAGDPTGGGNSDGVAYTKDCQLAAINLGTPNYCANNVLQENIAWRNMDDGFDTSATDIFFIGNVALNNGPEGQRGFKMLLHVFNATYGGNMSIGSYASGTAPVQFVGYDLRIIQPDGLLMLLHNLGTRHSHTGVGGGPNPTGNCANNVAWENAFAEVNCASTPAATNYNGDVSGTPPMVGPLFDFTAASAAAESAVGFPAVTIASRWATLYGVFASQFTPISGSSLINTGTFVSGYHCPLADDNGQNLSTRCRHWLGATPDIGPFERGITGNPDITKYGDPVTLDGASPILTTSPASFTFVSGAGGVNPPTQTLLISNSGVGTMDWTITDNVAWLTVAPSSGTGAASPTVSVSTGGLTAGTYNANITVTASGASGSPDVIPVTLNLLPVTSPAQTSSGRIR